MSMLNININIKKIIVSGDQIMMGIDLAIRKRQSYAVIDVIGNIAYSDVNTIKEYIQKNLTQRTSNVILNMKKTPIVSNSALPLIHNLREALTNTEKNLFLMNVNDELQESMATQGFDKKFDFINNENTLELEIEK